MAYYNYPVNYQPFMQQSMPAANTQQRIIWVQGEAAA